MPLRRSRVAGLQQDPPQELDAGLLTTDTQIAAVQVLDSSGAVGSSIGGDADDADDRVGHRVAPCR